MDTTRTFRHFGSNCMSSSPDPYYISQFRQLIEMDTEDKNTLLKIKMLLKEKRNIFSTMSSKYKPLLSHQSREDRNEEIIRDIALIVQEHYDEDLSE